jgi:hypothetical protein
MEQLRSLSSRVLAPKTSVLGDPLAPAEPLPGTVHVTGNVNDEWLPLAGRTVGEIRRRVGSRYELGSGALATVGGQLVGDDVVVRAGEHLAFLRDSGEKGARAGRRP